jgi:hypothetical protein
LQRLAAAAGGRAWLFCAQDASDQFTEFVEWQTENARALVERSDVAEALAALAWAFPPGESETWVETKI